MSSIFEISPSRKLNSDAAAVRSCCFVEVDVARAERIVGKGRWGHGEKLLCGHYRHVFLLFYDIKISPVQRKR